MTLAGWAQLVALAVAIVVTGSAARHATSPTSYEGGPSKLDRVFDPVERWFYRACRIDPEREQRWNVYAISLIAFSVVSFLVVYGIAAPAGQPAVQPDRRQRRRRPRWRSTPPSAS